MENTITYPEPCDLHWEATGAADSESRSLLIPLFLLLPIIAFLVWIFVIQMKKEEHLLKRKH
jgi:flagellar biogenesis protein FliO